jgi:hypothetical protein
MNFYWYRPVFGMLLPTIGQYTGLDNLLDYQRGLRKVLNQGQNN